ncbi:hypothetical protein EPN28_01410 [Patescibacteria group bacterium]|nr:MAG: hypothetical protein EPN28_01410 [Patescibacteria group bacterium]
MVPEKKPINVAVCETMLQFLRDNGHDIKPLFARLPYSEEYFKGGGRWVEEWVVNTVADYIRGLYGSYEILEKMSEDAFRRRQFGFLSAILTFLFSPQRVASILMKIIDRFLDKTAEQKKIEYGDGYFRWVLARKKEYGPAPSGAQIFAGKGNVKGLITHFGCADVKIKLSRCYVSIDKMGPLGGKKYRILENGDVESVELLSNVKKIVGHLDKDGAFFLAGTLYGAKDAEVEVTWKPLRRMESLRLYVGGLRLVGSVNKINRKRKAELKKKLAATKDIREKLKWEKNWISALRRKLEQNVLAINDRMKGKQVNLYQKYVELKEWEEKGLEQEKMVIQLKAEIEKTKQCL